VVAAEVARRVVSGGVAVGASRAIGTRPGCVAGSSGSGASSAAAVMKRVSAIVVVRILSFTAEASAIGGPLSIVLHAASDAASCLIGLDTGAVLSVAFRSGAGESRCTGSTAPERRHRV